MKIIVKTKNVDISLYVDYFFWQRTNILGVRWVQENSFWNRVSRDTNKDAGTIFFMRLLLKKEVSIVFIIVKLLSDKIVFITVKLWLKNVLFNFNGSLLKGELDNLPKK